MILNSIFTIEISSFVGLFIEILKEQHGVIYKGGGIYNDFPQNVFLNGGYLYLLLRNNNPPLIGGVPAKPGEIF